MRPLIISLLLTSFAPFPSLAESDVLLEAVGFALTGSDNAKVQPINRAKCMFRIGSEVFHLNNVHVDRVVVQNWSRRDRAGEESVVKVELHGSAPVYERTDPGIDERKYGAEFADALKREVPNAFKPSHTSSNEYTLTLATSDGARVTRAWQYIYSHGCVGSKSPF
jgi:hypothetical protein